MNETTPDLADAIAAANALYDTATELRAEAWLWNTGCRAQLLAEAVEIEQIARVTFRGIIRLDVADAFEIAARHRLAEARTLRRFIQEIYPS